MSLILRVIDDVAQRLSNPRAWLQGEYEGFRHSKGHVQTNGRFTPNCCCVMFAVSAAAAKVCGEGPLGEVRLAVSNEILATVKEATGRDYPNLAHWNDDPQTSFVDVVAALAATYFRLTGPVDVDWELAYNEVRALAEIDARNGQELRVLTDDLASFQCWYDERFQEVLCEMLAAKEAN